MAVVLKCRAHQNHLEGVSDHRLLGPDSVGLEWDLRMCVSHKLPGDAVAAAGGLEAVCLVCFLEFKYRGAIDAQSEGSRAVVLNPH